MILDNCIGVPPDLVAEILSPSTAAHDRATRLAPYAEVGVPWVWFLNPEAKAVGTLKLGQEILRGFHPGGRPEF